MQRFLMGNEAMALGAIHAGVNVVCGYPGTPSTEVLERVARENKGDIYVEWSTNEKAALEVAAGASYAGARTLVTMKQVGLNVASDPLMSLAYVGVKGGMVVLVADDPGPISSQTEQDTRTFAAYAKLPVFDPATPQDAYQMMLDAFQLSEQHGTPVLLRPTTRICHACAAMEVADHYEKHIPEGFIKDTPRWVIFPRTSYQNHLKIEARNPQIGQALSAYPFNQVSGSGTRGIVTGGVSHAYTLEALALLGKPEVQLLQVGTPFPFPESLALKFLLPLEEVLVIEELDPVLERALLQMCGKHHLSATICGKLTGDMPQAGENTVEDIQARLASFLDLPQPKSECTLQLPDLPARPPVLCAGCPHRASFYAVKQAMQGQKSVYAGDIGCYTLGNAMPLDMTDTCLCMGADITIAQGIGRVEPNTKCFSFIGDSTFFASGLTGIANAVYNQSNITIIVLDNSITAMTGGQPHPGIGKTMMGKTTKAISIPKVLEGLGVEKILQANPFHQKKAISAVQEAAAHPGVSAVIFQAPCINLIPKPEREYTVATERCTGCKNCITEIGCPAITMRDGHACISASLCYGCALCAQICPEHAIRTGGTKHEI